MRRFPLRTLLLMLLALVVFGRLYYATHHAHPKEAENPPSPGAGMTVEVAPPSEASKAPSSPTPPPHVTGASPACLVLDRALDAVVRDPENGSEIAKAQRQMESCPTPPERACELGAALAARAPPSPGFFPARPLLQTLCERCPAESNPCAGSVARALEESAAGHMRTSGEVLWSLEHAGPGTGATCAMLVRMALIPAATTGGNLNAPLLFQLSSLAPPCAREEQLPAVVLNAAVIELSAHDWGLAKLATTPAATSSPMTPEQITGAEAGSHAFDGKEKSGVDLGNGQTPRWEADGALRGQFEPPLKQLTSLRVRAKGAGTLRAIVRTPPGLGLKDPERGTFFVNPTVCQFKGTGQWETCELKVPLLDVEAISVFPALPKISLYEVEMLGTR